MLPGFEETARLGPRVAAGLWLGQPAVCKVAEGAAARSRLAHEATVLHALDGLHAPHLLAAEATRGALVIARVPGRPLPADAPPGAARIAALRAALDRIHARGWIHCDVKPSNVLVAGDGAIRLVDWEHALPVGADLSTVPQRAWSPGRSHPDLIWGRGIASPELDLWAVSRLAGGMS